jgi:orotidine-5'-phosphate decarboxylase
MKHMGLKVDVLTTIDYINETYPAIFTIADAKRGDIGNTSSMYAKAF